MTEPIQISNDKIKHSVSTMVNLYDTISINLIHAMLSKEICVVVPHQIFTLEIDKINKNRGDLLMPNFEIEVRVVYLF